MLRLYPRTLLLIIVISAAIFTVRLIGKVQPVPSLFAVIFTNPDGSSCEMPCMFGVRPGEMSRQEAIAILKKHPITEGMKLVANTSNESTIFKSKGVTINLGGESDWIGIYFTNDANESLFASSLRQSGSLGNAIAFLGKPEQIMIEESSYNRPIIVLYPTRVLSLGYQRRYLTSILADDLPQYVIVNPQLNKFIADPFGLPWKGFGYAARYSGGSRNAP